MQRKGKDTPTTPKRRSRFNFFSGFSIFSIFSVSDSEILVPETPLDTRNNNQKLLDAAKRGSTVEAEKLLLADANINSRETRLCRQSEFPQFTPLMYAVNFGQKDFVRWLLNNEKVNGQLDLTLETQGYRALHFAAYKDQAEIFSLLLHFMSHTEDYSSLTAHETKYGFTPLHFAAMQGNDEICEELINSGFIKSFNLLTEVTNDGVSTPIHVAIEIGHLELADKLINELKKYEKSEKLEKLIHDLENYFNFALSLSSSKDLNCEEIENNWQVANYQEYLVMQDILSLNLNDEALENFLKGGHLCIDDNGHHYQRWVTACERKLNRQNASSHKSEHDQFSIQGSLVREGLFGTIKKEDGKLYTWIQLESHSIGLKNLPGHLLSYLKYISTGRNQGPYGSSVYTDRNPIEATTVVTKPLKEKVEHKNSYKM